MKKEILITLLCAGLMLVTPFTTIAQENKVSSNLSDEPDVEPKDYVFQIIIGIANNPDVKELLKQYDNELFRVVIDRSIYHKLPLKNPKLFLNTLFTKPSMSVEYLNKCYNKGIEVTNILGEDKVIEIMESTKVTNPQLLEEILSIISNDEVLNNKIETLKIMNRGIIQIASLDKTLMCLISMVLFIFSIVGAPIFLLFAAIFSLIPFKICDQIAEAILEFLMGLQSISFIGVFIHCFTH